METALRLPAVIEKEIELYKAGEVSLSRAAEIAGMNIEDFKHVLSKRGVKRTIKPGADIDKKVDEITEWSC